MKMKTMTWWAAAAVAVVMTACGGAMVDEGTDTGRLALKPGQSLEGAQECGVDLPACGEGLACLALTLEDGTSGVFCLDPEEICEQLSCSSGQCVVEASYPGRISCSRPPSEGGDNDTWIIQE